MRINAERLESRDNPSQVVPAAEPGWADFAGTVVRVEGDLDGNGVLDKVYAGLTGAGNRVTIDYQGKFLVPLPGETDPSGLPVLGPEFRREDLMAFSEAEAGERRGLDVAVVSRWTPDPAGRAGYAYEPGVLCATWFQPGGGPVLWSKDFKTGETRQVLLPGISADFRGGVHLEAVGVQDRISDLQWGPDSHLVVTARRGGAPLVFVYGLENDELVLQRTIVAGDIDSRDGVYFMPTLVGTMVTDSADLRTAPLGFFVQVPFGLHAYGWDGTDYGFRPDTAGTDPGWNPGEGGGRLPNLRRPDGYLADQAEYLDLEPWDGWQPGDPIFVG